MKRVIVAEYQLNSTRVDLNDVWSLRYVKTTSRNTRIFNITMRDNAKALSKLGVYSNSKLKYPYTDEDSPDSIVEIKVCYPGQRLDTCGVVIWKGLSADYSEQTESEVLDKIVEYMDSLFGYVED